MTVLIVEDDLGIAELIKEQLEDHGYNTWHTKNAKEALSYLHENSPYLMLLDYSLPDMSGKELLSDLKEKHKGIPPFIVTTGQGDERIAVEMMKLGARDYIIKDRNFLDILPAVVGRVEKEITNENRLKYVERALRESEMKYRTIVENITDALLIHDFKGNIIDANETACRMLGYEYKELIEGNLSKIAGLENNRQLPDNLVQIIRNNSMIFEGANVTKDGSVVQVEISAKVVSYEGDGIIHSFMRDIAERKRYEQQLKYLSLHDNLTGLYNRTFFEEEINRLGKSREFPLTIISADLDGLKLINDTLGHDVGDDLLKTCANILKLSLRSSDILARVGGDEFSIILPSTDEIVGNKIVERINRAAVKHNENHPLLPISISLGISTAKYGTQSLLETLKMADDSMYRSKLHKGSSPKSHIITTLMTTLKERDYITEGHAQRVGSLSLKVAKEIGLSSDQLDDLALLARVHDIGKVGIPDNILLKKGTLTEKEWEIMRKHPEKGFRIAASSPELSGIADFILKHHEKWNGSGYPLGLRGNDIPIKCRILAIVDAFDAMTSNRPYRKPKSIDEAIAEIKKYSGKQFDPEMVEAFLSVLAKENEE